MAVLLTAAFALAACSGPIADNFFPPTAPRQQQPPQAALALPTEPPPAPVAPETPPGVLEQAPGQLLGMAQPQIADLLGTPAFVRRDNGAEIWQYRNDDCVLHLFLYADDVGASPRVSYVELRERSDGRALTSVADQRGCLGALVAQRSTA